MARRDDRVADLERLVRPTAFGEHGGRRELHGPHHLLPLVVLGFELEDGMRILKDPAYDGPAHLDGSLLIEKRCLGMVAGSVDSTFLWDMVSMGTLTAFMVVSIAVPVIRKRQGADSPPGFRVPFGPYVVPGLSVLACLYIMKDLSPATFRVFFIWMAVAVVAYFGYGMRSSRLNKAR